MPGVSGIAAHGLQIASQFEGVASPHMPNEPSGFFLSNMPFGMSKKTGIGAAAGGVGAFALCAAQCPGGVKNLNPLNMLPDLGKLFGKDEADTAKSAKDACEADIYKKVCTVEKELCFMNCKITGILGAGAGAAVGSAMTKKNPPPNQYGAPQQYSAPQQYGRAHSMGNPPYNNRGGPLDEWSAGPFVATLNNLEENMVWSEGSVSRRKDPLAEFLC